MSTTTSSYALGHTTHEYDRVRAQALAWEHATARLLDEIGVPPGARCLDAGSGPGETMRLLADRAGPQGSVLGIDADPEQARTALARLRTAGYRQCDVLAQTLHGDEPTPGGPFDIVFARLLLFHLTDRAEVLARLWEAVAPGGCLVIQEYDLRAVRALPEMPPLDDLMDIITGAFDAVGADVAIGSRLPWLFRRAGIGAPDGTDVSGRLETVATGRWLAVDTARSVLPAAVSAGVTSHDAAAATFDATEEEARRAPETVMLWPLLIGAWKRKGRS